MWADFVDEQLRVGLPTLMGLIGQPWPDPGHLTLSFAPDGTNAGGAPSGLFNLLNAQDSTPNWETAILRAFQTWAVNTNVNVGVVNPVQVPSIVLTSTLKNPSQSDPLPLRGIPAQDY